jgi:hypothetical protein
MHLARLAELKNTRLLALTAFSAGATCSLMQPTICLVHPVSA